MPEKKFFFLVVQTFLFIGFTFASFRSWHAYPPSTTYQVKIFHDPLIDKTFFVVKGVIC